MKVTFIEKVTIEIDGKDLTNLKTALEKITDEICKPGLKNNSITSDEVDVINKLNEKINP